MDVTPFRGIRYNRSVVGDVANVICPPYDVISPEQQRLCYERSDYNAIRLEFPEPTSDRYQRAATTFQDWLERGTLRYDKVPSYYLHEHRFQYLGVRKVRRGLIARVKLEPWGSGIFPHEETSPKDKSDRLQLLRACRANFSPLFSLYHDSAQRIASILSEVSRAKPMIETSLSFPLMGEGQGESAEAHSLWAVTDPETRRELVELLSSRPICIADGHHRYETALTYRQERAQVSHEQIPSPLKGEGQGDGHVARQSAGDKQAFNYVMMELVDFSDPGLVVLPLHRLVRGISPSALAGLEKPLQHFFTLGSVRLSEDSLAPFRGGPSPAPVIASGAKQSRGCQDIVLGVLGLRAGTLLLLRRRQDISLEGMMPGNRSQAYRDFGISILNHVILDAVLSGAKDLNIAYTVNVKEAYQQVKEGKYQLAFLLKPPKPEMVKTVADAQDRMPRKSTYFYPKVPAGLVINPLD